MGNAEFSQEREPELNKTLQGDAQVGHEAVGSIHEDSQAGLGLHHPNFPGFKAEKMPVQEVNLKVHNTTVIYCQATNNAGIIPKLCPESVSFPLFSSPQQMVALWGLLLSHVSQAKRKPVLINMRQAQEQQTHCR